MTQEHFDAGIRHLEIAFTETMDGKRRAVYFQHLRTIPDALWDAGILRLADHVRFPRLPLIAEIGEACVPGRAETEDLDPWTRRWTTTYTPWTERLARVLTAALQAPPLPLQIPGPRDPLSEAEQTLLAQPAFVRFRETMGAARQTQIEKNKASQAEKDKRREEETPGSGSPYARGHGRDFLNVFTPESQTAEVYWTPERKEARREVLHRQLLWLTRRDEAAQRVEQFTEERPE